MSASDLPVELALNPLVQRRQSVFQDLITVFRKNTVFRGPRAMMPPPRPPSHGHHLTVPGRGSRPASPDSHEDLRALGGNTESEQLAPEREGEKLSRQNLLDAIRQKKEVIGKLRCQPWNMNRKRRTLKLAQKYLEQHESSVSRTQLLLEDLKKRGRLMRRNFSNFKTYLIPWEGKIKKIESHFGSVVSSYFTFLRWIVFVNIIITLIIVAFLTMPETIADATADRGRLNRTHTRKVIPEAERPHADKLAVVWHYDGYLKYSPLFYGYYSDDMFLSTRVKYAIPLAYFVVTMVVFGYSFFAILRKMAQNARLSKLSGSKAEQYIFNWKVFTGWDYTIGNSETAGNTVMAVVIKLRESIADCRVEGAHQFRCLQFSLRILANVIILAMLAFSIYCISFAVRKSQTAVEEEGNMLTKNQMPTVVATITHIFPMIFDLIGKIENYHPRTALRAHLTRVLVLYVLNYLTLIFALFDKLDTLRSMDPHSPVVERWRRQLGGRNPNLPRPPPFASRTFDSKKQMLEFADNATKRFGRPGNMFTRTTRQATTPQPFTVQPQFGPVNVNNPSVTMRNGTKTEDWRTTRVGPAPLPIFTPPPRTEPPTTLRTRVNTQYGGPDFPTRPPPVTTARPGKVRPAWTKKQPSTTEQSGLRGDTVIIEPNPTQGQFSLNKTSGKEADKQGDRPPQSAERKSGGGEQYNDDICWETMIGQEIVKLVTMDLLVTIVSIILIDFLRGLWIRHCSAWWCWDIETTFPEYGEFKVAENVLHIINNQGMIWLGLFFAPLLPALNNVKLIILMYIRGWAVMTCNVPAREIFRASRSSNFYLLILLLWLLLCTLPVGFVIASKRPSKACGPFARHDNFYTVVTDEIEKRVDATILAYMKHVASPGVVIPILLFLMLIIYFLVSLVRGLREANTDLQAQLVHERTEEKKKIFELAGGGNKKKLAEQQRLEKSRTVQQYVPVIEQKRREPWRAYNGRDPERDTELLASDSSAGESEDDSSEEEQPIAVLMNERGEDDQPEESDEQDRLRGESRAGKYQPSLGSLLEKDDDTEEETLREMKGRGESRSQSHSITSLHANVKLRSTSELRSTPSTHSYDVQSGIVEVATPEEIRTLMRPLFDPSMDHRASTTSTLSQFPTFANRFPIRELTSPLGWGPTFVTTSKRGSRNSFVSLYDDGGPMIMLPTARTRTSRELTPAEELRDGNGTEAVRDSKKDLRGTQPEFQPWPSIDEVKERRRQLQSRPPLQLGKSVPQSSIGPSMTQSAVTSDSERPPVVPPHRRYQGMSVSASAPEDVRRSESPTKRFRISVSPTRQVKETDNKRKYIIQSTTGESTSTIDEENRGPLSVKDSPRAPVVEFGEDDSPRVHVVNRQ